MNKVPYSSKIGSLMYAIICITPYIEKAMRVMNIFMKNPGKDHWEVVKWIFKYLICTSNYSLNFGGPNIFLARIFGLIYGR